MGMMVRACNPSTWEFDIRRWLQVKASLGYTVKPFLKQTAATKYVFPMPSVLKAPQNSSGWLLFAEVLIIPFRG